MYGRVGLEQTKFRIARRRSIIVVITAPWRVGDCSDELSPVYTSTIVDRRQSRRSRPTIVCTSRRWPADIREGVKRLAKGSFGRGGFSPFSARPPDNQVSRSLTPGATILHVDVPPRGGANTNVRDGEYRGGESFDRGLRSISRARASDETRRVSTPARRRRGKSTRFPRQSRAGERFGSVQLRARARGRAGDPS